jgi:hypothetical protein
MRNETMSLTSLTTQPSNIFAAPTTVVTPPSQVPGTRDGGVPTSTPPAAPTVPSSLASLEQYKAKPDNTTNQVPQFKPLEIPSVDQFGQVADTLAGAIQINPDLAAGALQGKPEALTQLLHDYGKQIMQQAIHASAVAANQMTTKQAQHMTEVTASQVGQTQAMQSAIAHAVSENPALATGMPNTLLTTALTELRKTYPTAPAELLAKEAVRQLGSISGGASQQQVPQQTDWSTFV